MSRTIINRRTVKLLLWGLVLTPAFAASCVGFIRPAVYVTEPLTHDAVGTGSTEPFPVLVVEGDTASVNMSADPQKIPQPPDGASYLVPAGKERSLIEYLNEHDRVHAPDSEWVLDVKRFAPDRQRIELYIFGDGWWGGVYDVTGESVTPRYRKRTGPGFALVLGACALMMNVLTWGVLAFGVRLFKQRARAAQQPRA